MLAVAFGDRCRADAFVFSFILTKFFSLILRAVVVLILTVAFGDRSGADAFGNRCRADAFVFSLILRAVVVLILTVAFGDRSLERMRLFP